MKVASSLGFFVLFSRVEQQVIFSDAALTRLSATPVLVF